MTNKNGVGHLIHIGGVCQKFEMFDIWTTKMKRSKKIEENFQNENL